jgi:putative Mn2+ efflux pump MntP
LKLVLVAFSVGLGNFAASIGLGLGGVTGALRLRVAALFGLFEAGMPVVGLLVGKDLASSVGTSGGRWLGGGLLVATGIYGVVWARLAPKSSRAAGGRHRGRLVVTAAALSVDNLVVGFALGTLKVPMPLAAVVIAAVSVGLSLLGLELGARLGAPVERYSEEIGALVLVAVGAAVLSDLLH